MGLYKLFFLLLNFYSICYFWIISYIFQFFNSFKKWRAVEPSTNELLVFSATKAAEFIRTRELKSSELVDAYVQRIEEVNGLINALVMDNFDVAKKQALKVDEYFEQLDVTSDEYKNLSKTKPLLGVPFTVKNNVYVKNFVCTAGVPARMQIKPCDEDCEAVKRLYDAGAILLGISNVPEVGLWWETSNRLFGISRNPYDLRRTPGGSSGGESALLSSAASVIGLVNDVGGSARIPATFCGVFGLKPGPGVLPFSGIYPEITEGYLKKMATASLMCRYAEDLFIFLSVLAGEEISTMQLRLFEPVNLKSLRIFYMEGIKSTFIEPLQSEMRQNVRKVAKYFEKKLDKPSYRLDLIIAHYALELYLTSFDEPTCPKISRSIVNFEYDCNCFLELIKLFFGYSDHTVPALIAGIHSSLPKPSSKYTKFVESKRDQLRNEIIELLGDDGIMIFPAHPTSAPFINQPIFTPFNFIYSGLWNALALPAAICPLGLNDNNGLPQAVQLICSPNQERLLLACSLDLENGFGGWIMPHIQKRFY